MKFDTVQDVFICLRTGKTYTLAEYIREHPHYSDLAHNQGKVWIDGKIRLVKVGEKPG